MHKGIILILFSALSFALSTVFAKITNTVSNIPAVEITFFRFITGFVIILVYVLRKRKPLKPVNLKFILLRALTNTIAVILFFAGIQYTTVTKANMMNMTYPVFVFLLAPFLAKEKNSISNYLFLLLTMAGIYLTIIPGVNVPDLASVNKGDLFSLASGITAGFAITYLRQARKYDSSYMIIFYLMFLGSILNLFIVWPFFVIPHGEGLLYLILSSITAVAGQFFITAGYRFIDAAKGSLVSASRIIFAILLGSIIFDDPFTLRIAAGGILILISLTGVSGIFHKNFGK